MSKERSEIRGQKVENQVLYYYAECTIQKTSNLGKSDETFEENL